MNDHPNAETSLQPVEGEGKVLVQTQAEVGPEILEQEAGEAAAETPTA